MMRSAVGRSDAFPLAAQIRRNSRCGARGGRWRGRGALRSPDRGGRQTCRRSRDGLVAGEARRRTRVVPQVSAFYAASCHPLYGKPVDPRLVAAHRKQVAAFDAGGALAEPSITPFAIPFEGQKLPAYLVPAAAHAAEVRRC